MGRGWQSPAPPEPSCPRLWTGTASSAAPFPPTRRSVLTAWRAPIAHRPSRHQDRLPARKQAPDLLAWAVTAKEVGAGGALGAQQLQASSAQQLAHPSLGFPRSPGAHVLKRQGRLGVHLHHPVNLARLWCPRCSSQGNALRTVGTSVHTIGRLSFTNIPGPILRPGASHAPAATHSMCCELFCATAFAASNILLWPWPSAPQRRRRVCQICETQSCFKGYDLGCMVGHLHAAFARRGDGQARSRVW